MPQPLTSNRTLPHCRLLCQMGTSSYPHTRVTSICTMASIISNRGPHCNVPSTLLPHCGTKILQWRIQYFVHAWLLLSLPAKRTCCPHRFFWPHHWTVEHTCEPTTAPTPHRLSSISPLNPKLGLNPTTSYHTALTMSTQSNTYRIGWNTCTKPYSTHQSLHSSPWQMRDSSTVPYSWHRTSSVNTLSSPRPQQKDKLKWWRQVYEACNIHHHRSVDLQGWTCIIFSARLR